MIRINCFYQAQEGRLEEALAAAKELVAESNKQDGCIAYDVFKSGTRPDILFFCETWRDEDALNKHSATPEFKRYCKEMTDRGLLKIERFEF